MMLGAFIASAIMTAAFVFVMIEGSKEERNDWNDY